MKPPKYSFVNLLLVTILHFDSSFSCHRIVQFASYLGHLCVHLSTASANCTVRTHITLGNTPIHFVLSDSFVCI